jgi:hypothetical protein
MAGWRLGAIVGNEKVIEAYRLIKRNIDCGPFLAMQFSAMEAPKIPQSEIEKLVREYEERMNALVAGLDRIGWTVKKPRGTLYVWSPHTCRTKLNYFRREDALRGWDSCTRRSSLRKKWRRLRMVLHNLTNGDHSRRYQPSQKYEAMISTRGFLTILADASWPLKGLKSPEILTEQEVEIEQQRWESFRNILEDFRPCLL